MSTRLDGPPPKPTVVSSATLAEHTDVEAVVVVSEFSAEFSDPSVSFLNGDIAKSKAIDKGFLSAVTLAYSEASPVKRVVFSPVGPLNRDYDDVRRYQDAATSGIKRAVSSGAKVLALYVQAPVSNLTQPHLFEQARLVSLSSALAAGYLPLECRESGIDQPFTKLVVLANDEKIEEEIKVASAIEHGRAVARDIGGSDPERMAAPNVAKYVANVFKDTEIGVKIETDIAVLTKEYPLLAAVSRAADVVERHRPAVIHLDYTPKGEVEETLFLVGKGITYDTGGADVKAGGVMAGMHRDKCGAAAVAGFFQTLLHLKPNRVRVVGLLAMVRNSIGPECYVADEIILSRAGTRVRVFNTDAEGRMVMSDLLCLAKEQALNGAINPRLFTIATLTGHAVRAYGEGYSIVMDNGPARKAKIHQRLANAGSLLADPFEISTVRREDYDFVSSKYPTEDVIQCNTLPSTGTPRGHQFPAAFLARASGLDRHGLDSEHPLSYSHLDIAGSTHSWPHPVTAAPLPALVGAFLLHA